MTVAADGAATQHPSAAAEAAWCVLSDVVRQVTSANVMAIGVSAAMHTMVPIDENGSPLCDATTWGDTRAREFEDAIRANVDIAALYRETGSPVRWLYWPARLRWWAARRPEIFAAAQKWVSIKEYVLHRLTGRWALDVGIASSTGLLDVKKGEWSARALNAAGLADATRLSALVDGDDVLGGLTANAAREIGLREGTPIIAGSSDGALANVGAAGLDSGATVITIGTSGAVRVMTDHPRLDEHEQTWCYAVDRLRAGHQSGARPWLVGGAVNNGGLVPAWICDRFFAGEGKHAWDVMLVEASRVDVGSAGLICRPHLTGERSPWWDPNMTGAFGGLKLSHGRAELARAALEGVAFGIAEIWDSLGSRAALGDTARLTGGVTRSPAWCALLADVLGVTLEANEGGDASARGAAMLAAMGVGALNREQVNRWVFHDGSIDRFSPQPDRFMAYQQVRETWRRAEPLTRSR